MKTVLLPGRWQAPGGPHAGHRYLIEKAIDDGYRVVIGIRDIPKSDKDPYDVETRMAQFRKLYGHRVEFITIPEDGSGLDVWYGRGVGWGIHEIVVPEDVMNISGTSLRNIEESTIWFTGIPCSGKTTLAKEFKKVLESRGYKVLHLDGDKLREGLCAGLGFTDDGRIENLRRVSSVAELANKEKIVVLASYVSPTNKMRDVVSSNISNLRMIHVKCDADTCALRDVKGMWKKAKAGEIIGFTGYDAPFEAPDAELVIDTANQTVKQSIQVLNSHFGIIGDQEDAEMFHI